MKNILLITLTIWTITLYSQNKYDFINFNNFIEIKGTEFIIASSQSWEKAKDLEMNCLLFIDTRTGQTKQVDFPSEGYLHKIEQVKIDSLDINKIIVSAQTIDLDGKKGINWKDPKQIIVLSPNGKEKTQLTDNNLFVSTWIINNKSGTIVIAGHYDTNKNGKYDKTDVNEIGIYDLKTLKLISKI